MSRGELRARTRPRVGDDLEGFGRADGQACLAAELSPPALLGRCGSEHPRLSYVADRAVGDEQLGRVPGDLVTPGQCPQIPEVTRRAAIMPGDCLQSHERGRRRHTQRRRAGVRVALVYRMHFGRPWRVAEVVEQLDPDCELSVVREQNGRVGVANRAQLRRPGNPPVATAKRAFERLLDRFGSLALGTGRNQADVLAQPPGGR
jgi:hypothetical protein